MSDQTYVVTGGNTGIGKAIAQSLAREQLHVVIVSRDPEKGAQAVADIRNATQHDAVESVVGDLGTVAGTHRLADALRARFPDTGVLVNNAGVWMLKRQINQDQLEVSFMVNHLAPFILSNRLLPLLQSNAPARIVNVNAGLYVKGKIDLEKTPFGEDFSRMGTYANTKLCNLLFTRELAKRINGSGLTVSAVHPGVIRTNLGNTSGVAGMLLRLVKRSWASPAEGAEAPVWLATSPEAADVNGQYFDVLEASEVSDNAKDDELAGNLWALSADLAGMAQSAGNQ